MSKKVLIVEDYENIKDVYATVFGSEGFDVDLAENGKVALEKVSDNGYDLILLDVLMLEMDGIDFLRKFKKDYDDNETKIIVVSNINAQDNPNIKKVVKEHGAVKYLEKAKYTPKDIVAISKQELEMN